MLTEGCGLALREASTYQDGTQIGKYGVPGGRLEVGEVYLDGLIREVREEAGLKIAPGSPFFVGEWRPIIRGVPHQIISIYTVCELIGGKVTLSDEHDDYRWVGAEDIVSLNIMGPDDEIIASFFNSIK